MEHAVEELAAAVADNPRLHLPIAIAPTYNISLNLSSILSMIPGSRFLNRLRKGRNWLEPSLKLDVSEMMVPTTDAGRPQLAAPSFPGPWEFFTSGYILGLIIMAILLHRIQNVVIPSPRRARRAYRAPLHHHTTLQERIQAALLPLDLSRTRTRFLVHLPSVYVLSKMLLVWVILILQTSNVRLSFSDAQKQALHWGVVLVWVETLGRWAMAKEMAQICWATFCAVCAAFLIEGSVKALDGYVGGGFPMGGVNSLSPFHLVSYAFLLHIYSSPIAHAYHPADGSPSRPDKHVVITITIALLQLSMFHVLSISKRLSTHRLLPTALTSMLSLLHFHTTVYFHLTGASKSPMTPPLSTTKNPRRPYAYSSNYPLLNYVPNMFETGLLAVIFLTVIVNGIAQFLVRGRMDHLFSGLGFSNGLPNDDDLRRGFFANLPYEDDFFIVLVRVGVACLEATGLRGWNNEVAPIQRPRIKPRNRMWGPRERSVGGGESGFGFPSENTYGSVRMGRLDVAQVQFGSTPRTPPMRTPAGMTEYPVAYDLQSSGTKRRIRRSRTNVQDPPRSRRGFNNDVRIIDLGTINNNSGTFTGPWYRNVVACWQFFNVLWGVCKGLFCFLVHRAHGRARQSEPEGKRTLNRTQIGRESDDTRDSDAIKEEKRKEKEREIYQRFLRGEDISDDEDDAVEESPDMSEDDDEEASEETDEEVVYEAQEAEEAVGLFTDLLRNNEAVDDLHTSPSTKSTSAAYSSQSISSGEMVLAHLVHGHGGCYPRPLTRRRWNALRQGDQTSSSTGSRSDDWMMMVGNENGVLLTSDRYYPAGAEERDKEKGLQHICVVCMHGTREVICWPCRCLTMCDSCRETLALRTPSSKHRCPCCRQIVDGFSKIYIP